MVRPKQYDFLIMSVWYYFNHREEVCLVTRDLEWSNRQMLHSIKKYSEDSAVVIE